jgi:protein TonB
MSYKALLFCPEEKTARIVTQILGELDFQVDPCNEPFVAVKKLTAEHFDAIVVDCENEQNASLLFKGAKGSGLNQQSLSVAVVEGQSGVAKAFRLGANLVLTKPINVEQSKGTLRVARGLLKKNEGSKTTSTAHTPPSKPVAQHTTPVFAETPTKPAPLPPVAIAPKVPVFTAPPPPPTPAAAASMFEVEDEPQVKPAPTEAALLESMRDPLAGSKLTPGPAMEDSKQKSPWQEIAKAPVPSSANTSGSITDASTSSTAASRISVAESTRSPFSSTFGQAAAAAPAPAREPEKEHIAPVEPPTFSSFGSGAEKQDSDGGGKTKLIAIAAIVLVVAAGGYFGWTKMHSAPSATIPAPQMTTAPAASTTAPAAPEQTATPATESATAPQQDLSTVKPSSQPTSVPASVSTPNITLSTSSSPAKSSSPAEVPAPKNTLSSKPEEALVVKSESHKASAPAPEVAEPVQPPSAVGLVATSDSTAKALNGLISGPTSAVSAPVNSLKVSQGVAQGLQIKRVQPEYPAAARQSRIQGAVELQATIGKDGSISSLKQLSGDRVLGRAALDAVKQWKYRPYLLDGQPVEIQTQITVNFKLP